MFSGNVADETRIVAHCLDLATMADDSFVGYQAVPVLVRFKDKALGCEAVKYGLKIGPLALDDFPGEAGPEYALGHFGQRPVVGQVGKGARVGGLGKQRDQNFFAALTFRRAAPDF